jgi:GNAT superfamily N-acetyltransferase
MHESIVSLKPSSCSIEVKPVAVDTIVDLRHLVLRQGLPREAALFDGDLDPTSLHLAAIEGGCVVGCVTLHVSPWQQQPAWQLRGMAVAPGRQKSGIGRALLERVDEHVAADPIRKMLWCNARVPAARFYQKLGWEIVSEMFEIPTAGPHFKMIKRGPKGDRQ